MARKQEKDEQVSETTETLSPAPHPARWPHLTKALARISIGILKSTTGTPSEMKPDVLPCFFGGPTSGFPTPCFCRRAFATSGLPTTFSRRNSLPTIGLPTSSFSRGAMTAEAHLSEARFGRRRASEAQFSETHFGRKMVSETHLSESFKNGRTSGFISDEVPVVFPWCVFRIPTDLRARAFVGYGDGVGCGVG